MHRGYEAEDPDEPCAGPPRSRAALDARVEVQAAACAESGRSALRLLRRLRKQDNRQEVATAEVVIAAYDALYSGLPIDAAGIGVILIDEGCWSRAVEQVDGLLVAGLVRAAPSPSCERSDSKRPKRSARADPGRSPARR